MWIVMVIMINFAKLTEISEVISSIGLQFGEQIYNYFLNRAIRYSKSGYLRGCR